MNRRTEDHQPAPGAALADGLATTGRLVMVHDAEDEHPPVLVPAEQVPGVPVDHESDEECAPFIDEDGYCSKCGASRPEEPCASCGGYAYHRPDCPTPDEVSDE